MLRCTRIISIAASVAIVVMLAPLAGRADTNTPAAPRQAPVVSLQQASAPYLAQQYEALVQALTVQAQRAAIPPPPPARRTVPRPAVHAAAATTAAVVSPGPSAGKWDRVAACESHGNWHEASDNGYYGGLQEDMGFWNTYDGPSFAARPDLATREQQITVAERARDGYTPVSGPKKGVKLGARGYSPWPVCGSR